MFYPRDDDLAFGVIYLVGKSVISDSNAIAVPFPRYLLDTPWERFFSESEYNLVYSFKNRVWKAVELFLHSEAGELNPVHCKFTF